MISINPAAPKFRDIDRQPECNLMLSYQSLPQSPILSTSSHRFRAFKFAPRSAFPHSLSFPVSDAHRRFPNKKWKILCFRHEEFLSGSPNSHSGEKIPQEPEKSEISTPNLDKRNCVTNSREAVDALLKVIGKRWTVPWTAETILQLVRCSQQTMMRVPSLFQKLNYPPKPNSQTPRSAHPTTVGSAVAATRRSILLNALVANPTSIILTKSATALELRFAVPDQTFEEAENSIPIHAQSLLKVKDMLMAESWVEAQRALRKSSAYLKQDLYTIIQGKPPKERPRLRKLYADLFNAVTRLDYAARDKDKILVWDSWSTISSSLDLILSEI